MEMNVPPRKLIEVALPLDAISRAASREKATPTGHPSTVHLWWARRPIAACRAVVLAQLLDDPSSDPERFPSEEEQTRERLRLLQIVEGALEWDAKEESLAAARRELTRSYPEGLPLVVDPFSGGASIPLAAQQLGLPVLARDLNPVAVMVSKSLVEFPARWGGIPPVHPQATPRTSWTGGEGLAADLRHYAREILQAAEEVLRPLYPDATQDGNSLRPIAWLWARTTQCPSPACGVPAPLIRSFWLSKSKGKEAWLRMTSAEPSKVRFTIERSSSGPREDGTVSRSGARCLVCGTPISLEYIRGEGQAGRIGYQMLSVVAEGSRRRVYIEPDAMAERAAEVATLDGFNSDLPRQALGFRVQGYGMTSHKQLFTPRQLVALDTFACAVSDAAPRIADDAARAGIEGAGDYANAIQTYLALAVDRLAMTGSSLVRWNPVGEKAQHMFGRQTLSMVWDFAEVNFLAGATGGFLPAVELIAKPLEQLGRGSRAHVRQADATRDPLPEPCVVVTDPPYYDNVGYADLSDVFYIWMRRILRKAFPDLFATIVTPKEAELIADPFRHGGKEEADRAFEEGFARAFTLIEQAQVADIPLSVFYAFKQVEEGESGKVSSTGWETMLEGLVASGLTVTGTWPVRTEMATRMRGMSSNALASSIVLVCRRRPTSAPVTDRRGFLSALRAELPAALRALQTGNIAPVDLAQAALGPGMAVYSRYSKVLEANGSLMRVRTALELINVVLDETLSAQENEFDADTRWALAWFEQYGMNPGPFGSAETLSKAKNTAVNGLVQAGILESRAGKVRLLDRHELTDAWDPATDSRLTVWEATQHLIRSLESGGETQAADLLRRLGGFGEIARELAYRLYSICERRRWPREAASYNTLVIAWPEVARLAAHVPMPLAQETLL